jgi:hypothetical protein
VRWAAAAVANINAYARKPQATTRNKNSSHDQGDNSCSHLATSFHAMPWRAKISAAMIADV